MPAILCLSSSVSSHPTMSRFSRIRASSKLFTIRQSPCSYTHLRHTCQINTHTSVAAETTARHEHTRANVDVTCLGYGLALGLGDVAEHGGGHDGVAAPVRAAGAQRRVGADLDALLPAQLPQLPLLPHRVHLHLHVRTYRDKPNATQTQHNKQINH
ncbi:Os03g0237201 [Oryza sativa Japonica Group]|uniref:Os03g0237201 protein n=1 Tax=Oryza sativa subsp. japonica TaxID=39947 RepID=A0A0P0VV60_ORYSJ|nr:hypothetical protein EE612_016366 [Oryza sativa]BAS83158.1 Os03g0237201 [Oryza sativa Japonica Group]